MMEDWVGSSRERVRERHFISVGNCLGGVSEVSTSLNSWFGKDILYQTHAYIITHSIMLLVDFAKNCGQSLGIAEPPLCRRSG